jgi:hypothetical protein
MGLPAAKVLLDSEVIRKRKLGQGDFSGLRRTYASLRAACGDDPVYIAQQLGHMDPRFTLSA